MNLEWRKMEMSDGAKLYLGKHHVGTVYHDGFADRRIEDHMYKARCTLPGAKSELGRFKTVDEGCVKLTSVVNNWILGAMGEI